MAKLGNYSVKNFGFIFSVFLFKGSCVMFLHGSHAACVCSDCQPHSAVYSSKFVFYPVTDSRRERCDNSIFMALAWNVKTCVPISFLSKEHFLIECLCLNLRLRLCRADTRLEDGAFLSSLGVQALYPGCWGEKQARGYVLGSCPLQSVCAVSKWGRGCP